MSRADDSMASYAQLTPEHVWQPRWVGHANGATALDSIVLCVDDPQGAAARYGRYTGLAPSREGAWHTLETARGTLCFATADIVAGELGLTAPTTPWIAAYTLRVADLHSTRVLLRGAGADATDLDASRCLAKRACDRADAGFLPTNRASAETGAV